MKLARVLLAISCCTVAAPLRVTTAASDLSGIWAVIDKVVLEPNEQTPDRIQIWGAFALARMGPGTTNSRGYLYFTLPPIVFGCSTCPPASAGVQTARNEWLDLKSVAGTGEGAGFGVRFYTGRVRDKSEVPTSPEPYPIGVGVVKLRGDHPIVVELKKLGDVRPPR